MFQVYSFCRGFSIIFTAGFATILLYSNGAPLAVLPHQTVFLPGKFTYLRTTVYNITDISTGLFIICVLLTLQFSWTKKMDNLIFSVVLSLFEFSILILFEYFHDNVGCSICI